MQLISDNLNLFILIFDELHLESTVNLILTISCWKFTIFKNKKLRSLTSKRKKGKTFLLKPAFCYWEGSIRWLN